MSNRDFGDTRNLMIHLRCSKSFIKLSLRCVLNDPHENITKSEIISLLENLTGCSFRNVIKRKFSAFASIRCELTLKGLPTPSVSISDSGQCLSMVTLENRSQTLSQALPFNKHRSLPLPLGSFVFGPKAKVNVHRFQTGS